MYPMAHYVYLWLKKASFDPFIASNGSQGLLLASYVYLWLHMSTYGSLCLPMAPNDFFSLGSLCIPIASYCYYVWVRQKIRLKFRFKPEFCLLNPVCMNRNRNFEMLFPVCMNRNRKQKITFRFRLKGPGF